MEYLVRRVRPGDWPEFRRLRLEALKDTPLAFVEQYDEAIVLPDEAWQERAARCAADGDRAAFVAAVGDRLIGTMTCIAEPEVAGHSSAQIVGVYLTPERRGSGVAVDLLDAVLAWAYGELRPDRLRLHVLETNDRARAFYRRNGFVESGATMAYPPDPAYTELELVHRPTLIGAARRR
jgi:GNAT superfamily N-acetyltransferase